MCVEEEECWKGVDVHGSEPRCASGGEGGRPRGSSQDEGGVEGGEDRGVKVGRVEERKKGREEGSRRAYTTVHYITAARAANPKNRIDTLSNSKSKN